MYTYSMSDIQIVDHPIYNRRVGDKGKPFYYDVDEASGDRLRVYESGTIYNDTLGRIHKGSITSDNAASMRALATAKLRESASASIVKNALERGIDARTAPEVVGIAIGGLVGSVLDKEGRPEARAKVLHTAGKMAGLFQDGREGVTLTDSDGNKVSGDAESVASMVDFLAKRRQNTDSEGAQVIGG